MARKGKRQKNRDKQPKAAAQPPSRGARAAFNPGDTNGLTPVWSISIFDLEGTWGRDACLQDDTVDHIWEHIFPGLQNYERMTWGTILSDRHRNHSVPIDRLSAEARHRLGELKMDDLDELFRIRLSGAERVWGIRDGRTFKLLWWDPEHHICPWQPSNT